MAPKRPAEPVPSIEELAERLQVMLGKQLADCEQAGEGIPLALGRLIIACAAEKRQQERAERALVAAYNAPGVVAFAVKLPQGERQALVRELQQLDSKRSGLA